MQIYSIFCYFQKKRSEYLCVTGKKCFFVNFAPNRSVDICQKKITVSKKMILSYDYSFKKR